MLDIKWVRGHMEEVKESLRKRGVDFDMAALLAADEKRRAVIKEGDDLRARQNIFADEIAKAAGSEREEKIAQSREIKTQLAGVENQTKEAEEEFSRLLYQLPNMLLSDVPEGRSEKDNMVLKSVGERRDSPEFLRKRHGYMTIAGSLEYQLNLIDTDHSAAVSGSRFGYFLNDAVRLELALIQFAMDHLTKNGFIPVIPPVLINEGMMRGMGYIDSEEDREERYFLEKDGLFLVGTSEQSIVPMYAGRILNQNPNELLPLRYAAFSTCFRREAGSYGKDTEGILRVHQFDKVEMVSFTAPEGSLKEHEFLITMQEEMMQALKLPYRVVQLCAGDTARPSARTVDIETWLPGESGTTGMYRETHSSSNTTDFQARRLNIRYRAENGKLEFVHILNGTAFAIGRTLIAILENYQQTKDEEHPRGWVVVPEVLQPYMAGQKEVKPAMQYEA